MAQIISAECNRDPSELNFQRLEQKQQVLQRLKSQLSTVSTPSIGDHPDVSYLSVINVLFLPRNAL